MTDENPCAIMAIRTVDNTRSSVQPFGLAENHDSDPHEYRIVEAAIPSWLEEIAAKYRRLRTSCDIDPDEVSLDGVTILSTDQLMKRFAQAAIPERRGGNFDVLRSDFGEMILALHGELEYGYCYGYRPVRDRELPGQPGRGIDQIGVKAVIDSSSGLTKIALILGEAKVSSDKNSPPAVVDTADDCLRKQHLFHLNNRTITCDKVVNAGRRCADRETQRNLLLAGELLRVGRLDRLDIICHSLVVRPKSLSSVSDFGTFKTSVSDFAPGVIRFIIFRLPDDDLEGMISKFAELARSSELEHLANAETVDGA
jgi:hypothetical protein